MPENALRICFFSKQNSGKPAGIETRGEKVGATQAAMARAVAGPNPKLVEEVAT